MAGRTSPLGLPYATGKDAAALAPQLQALAEAGTEAFLAPYDLTTLGDLMETPACVRGSTGSPGPYNQNVEGTVLFDTTVFNNMTGADAVLDRITIPQQDQSYWWLFGMQVHTTGATVGQPLFLPRLYVTSTDPLTGAPTTEVVQDNYQSPSITDDFCSVSGFARCGGGSVSGTLTHSNAAGLALSSSRTYLWAVRIVPARWS